MPIINQETLPEKLPLIAVSQAPFPAAGIHQMNYHY